MAFVRVVETKSSSGTIHKYARVVENKRKNGKVTQVVVANLGNVDALRKDIKNIVNGLLKAVGEKPVAFPQDYSAAKTLEFGVRYVAQTVWEQLELDKEIKKLLKPTRTELDYEKWIRMMVINKLSDPASKLGIFQWLKGVWWPEHGFEAQVLDESIEPDACQLLGKREAMKFYRAMDLLLPLKEKLEKHLYLKLRNLFNLKVDLVFYDVTSSYFEGAGPVDFAKLGYSRDKQPGKKQVVIGLIMCNGLPLGHEVFAGNRLDKKTVKDVLGKLKQQFEIEHCIFVGDRGMVSKENLEELEEKGFDSILALKKRRNNQVKSILLDNGPLIFCRESDQLEWCEIVGDDEIRYIVCRNPIAAAEQKESRGQKLKELEFQLSELAQKVNAKKRPAVKTIVKQTEEILSHKHGRRLLQYQVDEQSRKLKFERRQEAIKLEQALDGVYILRTKEEKIEPLKIIDAYKGLCDVERAFRSMKSVLELRPFYHHTESRVRAHTFICFLAYLIEKYTEKKLKAAKVQMSAEKAFASLSNMGIAVMKVEQEYYGYVTEPTYWQQRIMKAIGVKPPQRFRVGQNLA